MTAMHDPQRARQIRGVQWNRDQSSLLDLDLHRLRGQDTDARPERYRFLYGLNIVEMQGKVDSDTVATEEAVQLAADGQVFIETDKLLSVQIGGVNFRQRGQRVRRRGRHLHL